MDSELKKLRKSKGYTLEKLSKLSGVSTTYLSDLENGNQRRPSLIIIERIAIGLNEDFVKVCYVVKNTLENRHKYN